MTIQRFNESFADVIVESKKVNKLFAELRSALGERPIRVRAMQDYLGRGMRIEPAFVREVMEPYAIDIVTRLGAEVVEPTKNGDTIALSIIDHNPNFEGAIYRADIEDRFGEDIPYALTAPSLEALIKRMNEERIHFGLPLGVGEDNTFLVQSPFESGKITRNVYGGRYSNKLTRQELSYLKRIYA